MGRNVFTWTLCYHVLTSFVHTQIFSLVFRHKWRKFKHIDTKPMEAQTLHFSPLFFYSNFYIFLHTFIIFSNQSYESVEIIRNM